jgi:antitoxin (DNA-binding transcriptional repressor) of toxin-antitoxin stability system
MELKLDNRRKNNDRSGRIRSEKQFECLTASRGVWGEIIITRDGKPIASLVPLIPVVECSQAHGAIQRIRERISQIGPTAFEWDELKADRDSGRP